MFYETDKTKAARILFDAITDLESTVVDCDCAIAENSLCLGIAVGKVAAAREYLAATLGIPVFADEVVDAEPKRALEVVS